MRRRHNRRVSRLETLISEPELARRCDELAREIEAVYGDEPVLLLGVLKGSFVFLADLARRLGPGTTVDFVQISSYGGEKQSSGVFHLRKDHDANIEGRHVLIVEDIVDTGLTLLRLRELLQTRRPLSLRVVAMLSKPEARRHEALVDFVGFEIPNQFVVGYGLDHAERYRNLPYIALLHD